jgi:Mn2+/Fe2+ NRAMP family transporter
MIANVDVSSVVTGLQTGSLYGYHAIFVLMVLIVPLAVIQFASGYLGLVTGKGLGQLMRENFSFRVSGISSIPMAVTDFLSYVAEYAGIGIGMAILGVSPLLSLPVVYVAHNLLVLKRRYGSIERALLPISFVFLVSIISVAFILRPSSYGIIEGLSPIQPYGNTGFDYYIVANVGAVIMPFMLFYQAGATAEKRMAIPDAKLVKYETWFGSVVSEILMICILVSGTVIGGYLSVAGGSDSVGSLPGSVRYLIAIGLVAVGFLALVVISLASSWSVAEVYGWISHETSGKTSLNKFYAMYVLESFPALLLAMWFGPDLVGLIINLMVAFVIVLIPSGLLLGMLVSNEKVMGKWKLGKRYMSLYWILFLMVESAGISGILLYLGVY